MEVNPACGTLPDTPSCELRMTCDGFQQVMAFCRKGGCQLKAGMTSGVGDYTMPQMLDFSFQVQLHLISVSLLFTVDTISRYHFFLSFVHIRRGPFRVLELDI